MIICVNANTLEKGKKEPSGSATKKAIYTAWNNAIDAVLKSGTPLTEVMREAYNRSPIAVSSMIERDILMTWDDMKGRAKDEAEWGVICAMREEGLDPDSSDCIGDDMEEYIDKKGLRFDAQGHVYERLW